MTASQQASSERELTPARDPASSPSQAHNAEDASRSHHIKYTVTACHRCRQKKSRCDPGIPRCHHCARFSVQCDYWDAAKKRYMPRQYIQDLRDRVELLQKQLDELENDQSHEPDPETLVREAAVVKFRGSSETKYLGPSSGTTMTRILLQLAKKVTKSDSIKNIISEERARMVRSKIDNEESKPIAKEVDYLWPLMSESAAPALVPRNVADLLFRVYNVKVQTMYPVFHEPSLYQIFQSVYAGSTDPYKNFVVRMVIAIALQRGKTRFAGLADSYYLAAMSHFEYVVSQKDFQTLQCFILIGQYSLLTPTRTAVFYVIGLAVRLAEALGITEEATICTNPDGSQPNDFEIDMRRRLFWAVVTMDYGLAHALGRPAMMAREHIDVSYFQPIDDSCISLDGILQQSFSKRKWIAIHFYRMRMHQLEIRRTLYRRKRPTPQNEDDVWFKEMERKLERWRDASPDDQEGDDSGFNKLWFHGRYHTMIVFLFRPSPQIPRPSARAAVLCYEACEFNISMQRSQIESESVETTWAFTQSLFMAVNTILWTLSYAEVRGRRSRDEVQQHLGIALDAMRIAAFRWPGVNPAVELYEILIQATLRIYDTEGDIPVTAASPFDLDRMSADPGSDVFSQSHTSSPALRPDSLYPSLGREWENGRIALDVQSDGRRSRASSGSFVNAASPPWISGVPSGSRLNTNGSQFNPMPSTFDSMNQWQFQSALQHHSAPGQMDSFPVIGPLMQEARPGSSTASADLGFQGSWAAVHGGPALTSDQRDQLSRELNTVGVQHFETMIQQSNTALYRADTLTR